MVIADWRQPPKAPSQTPRKLNSSDQVVASYTNGLGIDDPLVMRYQGNNYFYHKNHLGSVTDITDSSGAIVKSYQYDAYGNVLSAPGALTYNTLTYTARERHVASGLYYYRARWYDPQLGRFITQDPIYWAGGINLYSYVGNNPINFVDPIGLALTCKGYAGVVLLAVGGVLVVEKAILPGIIVGGIGGILLISDLSDSQKQIQDIQEQKKQFEKEPRGEKLTPVSPYQKEPGLFPPDIEEDGTNEQFREKGREEWGDTYDPGR